MQDLGLRFSEYQVYVCYLRQNLYPNGPVDRGLQKLDVSDLEVSRDPARREGTPLFYQAALTFAILLFGARHKQTQIIAEGYDMHGVTLRRLNKALSIPGCHTSDEIINVIVIMAMLEMYMPSGPQNWLKHMLGLERMLELRDPGSLIYASSQTLELYKGVRHMILLAALRNRTPSIFARPRWKAVLRTELSLETPQEQDLHDVLADCSVLTAASDEIARIWDPYDANCMQRLEQITTTAMNLLASLSMWKEQWDSDALNTRTIETDFEAFRAGAPPLLQTIYRFYDDTVTRMFMLYNTALIHVLHIMAATEGFQSNAHMSSSMGPDMHAHVPRTGTKAAIYAAGIETARSILEYMRHRSLRGDKYFPSPIVQWAVLTAWEALGRNESPEGRWMMRFLSSNDKYAIAKVAWQL